LNQKEEKYKIKPIRLSKKLRWYNVPELMLPKDDDEYSLDASGDIISFSGIPVLRPARCKIAYTHEMIREIHRCRESYEYFIENYVQMATDNGFTFIKLRKYQKKILHSYFHNKRIILMMSRQMSKSSTTALYILYSILFGKDLSFGIAANLQKMAVEVLNIVKESYLSIPIWMQQGVRTWNSTSILLENKCKIRTSATTPTAFRGMTFSSHYVLKRKKGPDLILASTLAVDEVAFISSNIFSAFKKSVFPTVSAGLESKIFMFSTPNGMNHFKKMWTDAQTGTSNFKAIYVPWYEHPDRDEKWKEEKMKELGNITEWLQEYACEFSGSSKTLLSKTGIDNLLAQEPIRTYPEGDLLADLKIYIEPEEGHKYVCGVDTNKYMGDTYDYSSICVLDVTTWPFKQVAEWRTANTTYLDMVPITYNVCTMYNNAHLFVENNSGDGQSLVDLIYETYDYDNIYTEKDDILGFRTTAKSRRIGLNNLKKLIETGKLEIYDFSLIDELYNFILRNGKYQASKGKTDDSVMALVAALFFMQDAELFSPDDISSIIKTPEEDDNEYILNLSFFDDGSNNQMVW